MRILNQDNNTAVDDAILYLTEKEARILAGYLEQLLETPESSHRHMEDMDTDEMIIPRQLTVTLVREEQLHLFNERSRELWLTGK